MGPGRTNFTTEKRKKKTVVKLEVMKYTSEPSSTDMGLQYSREYSDRALLNLIKEEQKHKLVRFLDHHPEISPRVRARMIDWYVEIVVNFS